MTRFISRFVSSAAIWCVSAIFCLMAVMPAGAKTVKTPDFAYPATVSANSEAALTAALRSADDVAALRALIDLSLAQTMISADSTSAVVASIQSVGRRLKSVPARSFAQMLEATVLNQVYSSRAYMFNRRESPLTPLPANIDAWSGAQFRMRISELVDSALAPQTALAAVPLRRYSSLITADRHSFYYFKTLYDFLVYRAIEMLSSWTGVPHVFNQAVVNSAPSSLPALPSDPVGRRILGLYSSLISASCADSPMGVLASTDRINFLWRHASVPGAEDGSGQAEALMHLFDGYISPSTGRPACEWAGDILCDVNLWQLSLAQRRRLLSAIDKFLAACPAYWRKACLQNTRASLLERNVSVDYPLIAPAASPLSAEVCLNNVASAVLCVYNVSGIGGVVQTDVDAKALAALTPVARFNVAADSVSPSPFVSKKTVRISFPKAGTYVVVPQFEGGSISNNSYPKTYVSSVALFSQRFGGDVSVWAVDASTGEPLPDVSLSISDWRRGRVSTRSLGKTDAQGGFALPANTSGNVSAVRGADRFASPLYVWSGDHNPASSGSLRAVQAYTDLPIYHPGDTVCFVAVAYEYNTLSRRVLSGSKLSASLHNTTYEVVSSDTLLTDAYGRAAGSFVIPSDQLTGNFFIDFSVPGPDDVSSGIPGGVRFMVSDYKMPSFSVSLPSPKLSTPAAGDVTVSGTVLTNAGFPVEGAKVSLSLSVSSAPRFWFPSQSYPVLSLETQADASGRFSFVIPKAVFDASPVPQGYYTASVSALSPAGETQTSQVSFGLGPRYIIRPSLAQSTDVTSGTLVLRADVLDSDNKLVPDMPVDFTIVSASDSATVCRGTIRGGAEAVNVGSVSSGLYTVYYSLPDTTLAARTDMQTVLYRLTDKATPVPGTLLWSPEQSLTVSGAETSWLYATDAPAHLLVTLTANNRMLSRRWVSCPAGLNRLPVSLPDSVRNATLTVFTAQGYRADSRNISVSRPDPHDGLIIKVESMRNSLLPGSPETWTFRVSDPSGRGREAAVVADLYNTALDVLSRSDWSFTPESGFSDTPSLNLPAFGHTVSARVDVPRRPYSECPQLVVPEIQTYGHSFAGRVFYGLARNYKMAAAAPSVNVLTDAVEEMAVEEEADAAVSLAAGVGNNASADAGAEAAPQVPDAEIPADVSAGNFSFRSLETPLAFFRPMLTSAPDGSLSISFTVPDANARWGLRMVGWTDSLSTAVFSAEAVSSKPVMVQPNLPRFLRQGDDCRVEAMVMNATDSLAVISTTVEVFNPLDGAVIARHEFADTVAPRSSATVATPLAAPAGASFVGYRIRSASPLFADGVQTVVPVLPASAPVVETYPFYMAPDAHSYTMTLPALPSDGRMNLQFCENPVWYVVTALPGVIDIEPSTAPQAAYSLFSAAVAEGLVKDNPAIADAIREWRAAGSTSEALTSMLSRNAELKTVLLRSTPWMGSAASDTQRMERLALLFDRSFIRSVISKSVSLLERLQAPDGGWRWMSAYGESSEWATESVLHLLGSLNRLGYTPDNSSLRSMTRRALRYYADNVSRLYARHPDADYTASVLLLDDFPTYGVSLPEALVSSVVNGTVARWKSHSLPMKAIDAMLLHRHGHPAVARAILGSIREFAVSSPEKGIWFPSLEQHYVSEWLYQGKIGVTSLILDAFAAIEPASPEIDGIRQWLVLQKSAQDWGSSAITTEVIASFLHSSRSWLVPAQGSTFTVDGAKVDALPSDRLTGSYDISLPQDSKGTLAVSKPADTPAWGALYCSFTAPFSSVKSHACPELSIEKSLLLVREGQDPVAVTPDTELRPGDRLTVRLLVNCDLDMSYVAITDKRPACLEPVEQTPTPVFSEGLCFYRENRDTETRLFIDRLRKGTYLLSYDMWVNNAGTFVSGIAEIQSQYAPRYEAHSSAATLTVEPMK